MYIIYIFFLFGLKKRTVSMGARPKFFDKHELDVSVIDMAKW